MAVGAPGGEHGDLDSLDEVVEILQLLLERGPVLVAIGFEVM